MVAKFPSHRLTHGSVMQLVYLLSLLFDVLFVNNSRSPHLRIYTLTYLRLCLYFFSFLLFYTNVKPLELFGH